MALIRIGVGWAIPDRSSPTSSSPRLKTINHVNPLAMIIGYPP